MNEFDVKRLALILAKQAEIEGMKADNTIREQNNEALSYGIESFELKAQELENLAYTHEQQLFG